MRSVLIAAAASALLAAPAAGNDLEKELERATLCQIATHVLSADFTLVDEVSFVQVGRELAMVIDGAESLPGNDSEEITLCEVILVREAKKICQKNNRRRREAPFFDASFSLKRPAVDTNPILYCDGPYDARCFDPLFASYKMESFAASAYGGDCSDLFGR